MEMFLSSMLRNMEDEAAQVLRSLSLPERVSMYMESMTLLEQELWGRTMLHNALATAMREKGIVSRYYYKVYDASRSHAFLVQGSDIMDTNTYLPAVNEFQKSLWRTDANLTSRNESREALSDRLASLFWGDIIERYYRLQDFVSIHQLPNVELVNFLTMAKEERDVFEHLHEHAATAFLRESYKMKLLHVKRKIQAIHHIFASRKASSR